MTWQSASHLTVFQIPNLHRAGSATYYQHFLLLVEDDAFYGGAVPCQAHHGIGLGHLPDVDPLVIASGGQDLPGLVAQAGTEHAA